MKFRALMTVAGLLAGFALGQADTEKFISLEVAKEKLAHDGLKFPPAVPGFRLETVSNSWLDSLGDGMKRYYLFRYVSDKTGKPIFVGLVGALKNNAGGFPVTKYRSGGFDATFRKYGPTIGWEKVHTDRFSMSIFLCEKNEEFDSFSKVVETSMTEK